MTAVAPPSRPRLRLPAWLPRVQRVLSLRNRIVALTTAAVTLGILLTAMAAYLTTAWSLYDQMDADLNRIVDAAIQQIEVDIDSMGGLMLQPSTAANTSIAIVGSDGAVFRVPNDTVSIVIDVNDLTVARLQEGSIARDGQSASGEPYRIVTAPFNAGNGHYAIVAARPLTTTFGTLAALRRVLVIVGALSLVVAAALGVVIARLTLVPVRELAAAVANVTETDELNPIETHGNDELSELSRSFNTMLYSLASSRERQRRLIADAGHELRTPLTSLRTNIELLIADEQSGMLPEGARAEILKDVAAQLGEFTSLVGDLVHLSREGVVQADREPVDLRDIVANAVTRAKRRGPGLTFDVELNPLYINGESDNLERAVTNLLDNAVKFSPPGGTIRVLLEGDRLRISDQGPGIADEDLPHVFERFYRSDRARNTPGTGLGLSIVAHTVNSHGGWVKAGRSAEGGAEFTVRLPPVAEPEGDEEL